jgi:hypothetical protein
MTLTILRRFFVTAIAAGVAVVTASGVGVVA